MLPKLFLYPDHCSKKSLSYLKRRWNRIFLQLTEIVRRKDRNRKTSTPLKWAEFADWLTSVNLRNRKIYMGFRLRRTSLVYDPCSHLLPFFGAPSFVKFPKVKVAEMLEATHRAVELQWNIVNRHSARTVKLAAYSSRIRENSLLVSPYIGIISRT